MPVELRHTRILERDRGSSSRPLCPLLACLLFLLLPAGLYADYRSAALGNTDPASFRGRDPRLKQMRKAGDPWFGLNEQRHCPISGRRRRRKDSGCFVVYKWHRIWLSDKRLEWIFRKFPRRALRRLYDWGERPQRLPSCPPGYVLELPPPGAKH